MKFTVYQESRRGARAENQDRIAYSYTRESLIMVLADGMGGHLHGEIAAQIAVQYIVESFQREAVSLIPDELMFLSRTLSSAHSAILDYSFDKRLSETPRTTLVACLIQNNVAHWAHAGDSRLTMIRNGEAFSQTKDHSRVQLMIDQGIITEEEALTHPARNRVFSCLGGSQAPQIEFSAPTPLIPDDIITISTDGVWGNLDSGEMVSMLSSGDILNAAPLIMDRAEERGGASCDNLSMICMHWHNDTSLSDEEPSSVFTKELPDGITTKMDGFKRTKSTEASNLTDEDIEKAINEINNAIKKYTVS